MTWAAVATPTGTLGATDPTRRFGVVAAAGRIMFPGLTHPEADAAAQRFSRMSDEDVARALIVITLPVILSDGAGPYVLDVSGALVLVLAPHPEIADTWLLMGPPAPRHPIGLAQRDAEGSWSWIVRTDVVPSRRDAAIDALACAGTITDATRWSAAQAEA